MPGIYTEAWFRDRVYDDPIPLLRVLEEDCVFEGRPLPAEVYRWREYRTSVGRADLVLAWHDALIVAEFKCGVADEAAISQAFRYLGAIYWDVHPSFRLATVVAHRFTARACAAAFGAGVSLVCLTDDGEPYGADYPLREDRSAHETLARVINTRPVTV